MNPHRERKKGMLANRFINLISTDKTLFSLPMERIQIYMPGEEIGNPHKRAFATNKQFD